MRSGSGTGRYECNDQAVPRQGEISRPGTATCGAPILPMGVFAASLERLSSPKAPQIHSSKDLRQEDNFQNGDYSLPVDGQSGTVKIVTWPEFGHFLEHGA